MKPKIGPLDNDRNRLVTNASGQRSSSETAAADILIGQP
jgi:hypothetical protein